jgi:hypothetical protein
MPVIRVPTRHEDEKTSFIQDKVIHAAAPMVKTCGRTAFGLYRTLDKAFSTITKIFKIFDSPNPTKINTAVIPQT